MSKVRIRIIMLEGCVNNVLDLYLRLPSAGGRGGGSPSRGGRMPSTMGVAEGQDPLMQRGYYLQFRL